MEISVIYRSARTNIYYSWKNYQNSRSTFGEGFAEEERSSTKPRTYNYCITDSSFLCYANQTTPKHLHIMELHLRLAQFPVVQQVLFLLTDTGVACVSKSETTKYSFFSNKSNKHIHFLSKE